MLPRAAGSGTLPAVKPRSLVALVLLPLPLLAACDAESPYLGTIVLQNPSALTFEGSAGALGAGLEIEAPGLEDGRPLIVDPQCQGRRCGEPTALETGTCGVQPRSIRPGARLNLDWDGRYYPRSHDPFGECLAPARAVSDGKVTLTVCGRLLDARVKAAALLCDRRDVDVGVFGPDRSGELVFITVPGALDQPAFDAGVPPDAGPTDGGGNMDGSPGLDASAGGGVPPPAP